MTVESTSNKDTYTGNGSTREWPITFDINGIVSTEIKVYKTVIATGISTLITSGYEVDLLVPQVIYPTVISGLDPIDTDHEVLLVRVLEEKQDTDYKNQGSLPAETIEEGQDRLVMMIQQLQEEINRSFQVDISEDTSDLQTLYDTLNAAVASAEAAQSGAETAETNAETAETNAATSEANAATSETNAAASAAAINFRTHEQTFDADDLSSGVLTLTTPSGYTKMVTCTIFDEDNVQVLCGDSCANDTLALDLSSFEDSGDLTSSTTWTIRSTWGET